MKKSNKFAIVGAGFALAVAALAGSTSPQTVFANKDVKVEQQKEQRNALAMQTKATHRIVRENVGGLDLVQSGDYGMSPKEYGLRFGNGKSKNGKANFNRMSHNAKLKRR